MYTRKAYATRETPRRGQDDQPDAREGQAGRPGESERFIVPMKPGNAGGGTGPQFKSNATRSEGPGDWVTYQLRRVFRNCRWRCTRKRRQKPAIVSTSCTTRLAVRDILAHAYAQCRSNKGAPGVDGQDFADIETYGLQMVRAQQPDRVRRIGVLLPATADDAVFQTRV